MWNTNHESNQCGSRNLEGKNKKKAQPIEKIVDWVLAFSVFSQALLTKDPSIASHLLVFLGTVARLAWDHPGAAWPGFL